MSNSPGCGDLLGGEETRVNIGIKSVERVLGDSTPAGLVSAGAQMNGSNRGSGSFRGSTKRPRKGSARENWDRAAEAEQASRDKPSGKARRTSSGSGGRARTLPVAHRREVSATREDVATDQLCSPTRVTRRTTAHTAEVEAADAEDDASEGSDTHGERRVEALQRAATMRGGGVTASLVLVKWCSLPQEVPAACGWGRGGGRGRCQGRGRDRGRGQGRQGPVPG